jgi:FtsH-binding integral membrane protein
MAYGTGDRVVYGTSAQTAEFDVGLRQYMLSVYNYMALGLAATGAVALLFLSNDALIGALVQTQGPRVVGMNLLGWVVTLAPIGLVFFLSFRIAHMSAAAAQLTFWIYAGLMGASLSTVLFAYTGASVARVFFITASVFGAMSLWGYTTKRDLSGFGTFLFMGLIGILIASLVNIFLASSMMHWIISVAGVLIFTGLTAYDTQKIKEMYEVSDSGEIMSKKAIMGALTLYLDFINLFVLLLQFFGVKRDE